jgi:hypothetical protein
MTDQTKLREAVARAIDPVAFQEGSFAPFSCDGAREIADHILALPEIADALKLSAFGREVFSEATERVASGSSMGEEDERIMEIAEKHGLAKRAEYDPKIHEPLDVEPGDGIWLWGRAAMSGGEKK